MADVEKTPVGRGIGERDASAQPVAWVAADTLNSPHPTCISSLAYMSQLDRERGREYVPLYAAPPAQTVDLEQFREVVEFARQYAGFGERQLRFDRLLALIDASA